MPQNVQDFLLDPEAVEWADKLATIYKIPDNDGMALLDVAEETVLGITDLDLLPSSIMAETDCDWETAKKIAIELAGVRLLPVASLVGNVAGQIKLWGGDLAKFANIKPLALPEITAEDYVRAALEEWNVVETNSVLHNRLIFVLTSLIKGERTVEETKAALLRSRKVGGMEFAEDVAARVMELISERMKTNPPPPSIPPSPLGRGVGGEGIDAKGGNEALRVEDIKPVSPPPIASPAFQAFQAPPAIPAFQAPPTSPAQLKPSKKMEDFFQKDDEAEIARLTTAAKEKISSFKPAASVKEVAERIIQETGLVSPDEEFQKRFLAAIDSRWRGVRDAFGTRDVLEKSRGQGGLGLSGGMLVKAIETLEKMIEENNRAAQAAVAKPQKTGQEKSSVASTPPALPVEKKKTVGNSPPKPKTPVLSANSLSAQIVDGRPRVDDITFVRKLAGPIEELQNLSVEEFRRLSSDPQEAAIKLRDKIDLLEEQGIGKKLAGIKAWHTSPVNRLYLDLSKEALLSSKPIEGVCRLRRERGGASFSHEELLAIVSLNKDLRF